MDIFKPYSVKKLQSSLAASDDNPLALAIRATVAAYGCAVLAQGKATPSDNTTFKLPKPRTAIERFAFELVVTDMAAAGYTIVVDRSRKSRPSNNSATDE